MSPEKLKSNSSPNGAERNYEVAGTTIGSFIRDFSAEKSREGLPLTSEARVDMDFFAGKYSEEIIAADKEYVRKMKEKFAQKRAQEILAQGYRNRNPAEILEGEDAIGKKLEELKTAFFCKFLGNDFVCVRTSEFDDIKNGIDNIICEKATSNIVCAVDEVADKGGERFNQKIKKISKDNEGGGRELKYGFFYNKKFETFDLAGVPVPELPTFLIAMSEAEIDAAIEIFKADSKNITPQEQRFFNEHFLNPLLQQAELWLRPNAATSSRLRKKISDFRSSFQKYKNLTPTSIPNNHYPK